MKQLLGMARAITSDDPELVQMPREVCGDLVDVREDGDGVAVPLRLGT
ncbi:hypothetical protein LG315_03235 [Microbacterium marinum]